jgi:hypothetical protein
MDKTKSLTKSCWTGWKKKIEKVNSEWAKLPKSYWMSFTTQQNFTSETPFLLTYSTKVVISAEIGCPSYKVLHFSTNNNDE